jgi:hypothetical protein
MIAHLVLFRFQAGVSNDDDKVRSVVTAMEVLPSRIPTIRAWEHGFNMTPDMEAWDYSLRALFDNEQDLHAYFEHPDHLAVLRQWDAIAELGFCDFRLS